MTHAPDLPQAGGSGALRLGLVTETWPPEINGVAHTLRHMVRGLLSRGHAVSLVRPRQRADGEGSTAMPGVAELLLPGLPIPGYSGLRFGLPARRAIQGAWRVEPPDVVYLATEGPLGHSALSVARALNIPVVGRFHTNFHSYSRYYRLGILEPSVMALLRRFHNRCNLTLVPTGRLRAELMAQGFRNCRVLARGVDTRLFDPARRDSGLRAAWGVDDVALAVLYVGRLAAEKNLRLAVETFRSLQGRHRDARFILVGDGRAAGELKRHHPDFVFCGTRTGEELARHYASADMFLFPSMSETFGNVVLEAMASGLAIVAFDYAAARQHLQDGRSGALVSLGDAHGYVASARALAEDVVGVRQIGTAARHVAVMLDWDHIHDTLEGVLLDCVPGGRANETAATLR